jgi:hypothetical protein
MSMQIGQGAQWSGRVLPIVVLLWDLPWFSGAAGNRLMWLSTAEVEYIALCVAVHEAVWLRKLLADFFGHEMDSTVIHCDNQSCVKLSENHVFHDKSKHIEIKYQIKYHYIRDMVQRKAVHVQYLSTHKQVADVFTKPLASMKFEYFRERLGLVENASLVERES